MKNVKLNNLVKKVIKEELLDEVGGYDSFELGSQHSDSTMEVLVNNYEKITNSIYNINRLQLDILDDKLVKETKKMLMTISPILERYGKALHKAEQRRSDRFNK